MLGCLYINVKPDGERHMSHTLSRDAHAVEAHPHPQAHVEVPAC